MLGMVPFTSFRVTRQSAQTLEIVRLHCRPLHPIRVNRRVNRHVMSMAAPLPSVGKAISVPVDVMLKLRAGKLGECEQTLSDRHTHDVHLAGDRIGSAA